MLSVKFRLSSRGFYWKIFSTLYFPVKEMENICNSKFSSDFLIKIV
jgi:hypothetical protein